VPDSAFERVAVAGVARFAAWVFWGVGGVAVAKGAWDLFVGQPEANFFSQQPWSIVSRSSWFRFIGFEIAFGVANGFSGWAVWLFSRRLPPWFGRPVVRE
jgi:hypothetical protein